jgi:hypothetical protein
MPFDRAFRSAPRSPHKLDVPDQTNQVQGFATMKKSRGLILIFSRSLSW